MTLTNDTAKVDFIAESISQELFDGMVVFLIDVDNLKIRDSTVTRSNFVMPSFKQNRLTLLAENPLCFSGNKTFSSLLIHS